MSKKIILFCASAFVVALAASAYAEVQNVRVGGDITVYGVYRDEYDLNDTAGSPATDDSAFYASIVRLRIDADLTDNVAATIRLLNERAWDTEGIASTDIDLDLAYITLKEMLYSPLSLSLGRQPLRFGNALIVGDPDTNASVPLGVGLDGTIAEDLSARKAFDALRGTLDYAPWTVDLIAAKIAENDATGISTTPDETLYGVNVGYKLENALVEGYLFVKDGNEKTLIVAPGTVNLTWGGEIYNLGLVGTVEPMTGLNLAGEVAYQFGDAVKIPGVSRDQRAWALDLDAAYTWDIEYAPSLGLGYSYRSGEEAANTGDYEAWNPMYEDQTQGVIADYILSGLNGGVNSNASIIKLYGSIKPTKDITLAAKYYNFRLNEKLVGLKPDQITYLAYPSRIYAMRDKKELGNEIDLIVTYDYTEDVQFGLTGAYFRPGDAFGPANDDEALALLGSVKLVF